MTMLILKAERNQTGRKMQCREPAAIANVRYPLREEDSGLCLY